MYSDPDELSGPSGEMEQLFDKQKAENLARVDLDEARAYLVRGLSEVTGIPLEYFADPHTRESPIGNTIHCTDVRSPEVSSTEYSLTWKGFIASSDFRDDGILVFGAHLFPIIGGRRACLQRQRGEARSYDYAFRYLMLTKENGWEDRGWHVDEYGEFEHWYSE